MSLSHPLTRFSPAFLNCRLGILLSIFAFLSSCKPPPYLLLSPHPRLQKQQHPGPAQTHPVLLQILGGHIFPAESGFHVRQTFQGTRNTSSEPNPATTKHRAPQLLVVFQPLGLGPPSPGFAPSGRCWCAWLRTPPPGRLAGYPYSLVGQAFQTPPQAALREPLEGPHGLRGLFH